MADDLLALDVTQLGRVVGIAAVTARGRDDDRLDVTHHLCSTNEQSVHGERQISIQLAYGRRKKTDKVARLNETKNLQGTDFNPVRFNVENLHHKDIPSKVAQDMQ